MKPAIGDLSISVWTEMETGSETELEARRQSGVLTSGLPDIQLGKKISSRDY